MLAHKVQDDENRFARGATQAAAELLNEDRRAGGRTQHEHNIHRRDIDALVEDIDGEDASQLARLQLLDQGAALVGGRGADYGGRRKTPGGERLGHVVGMVN